MTPKITDQLLVECLDLLDEGMSLATILARYPEDAEALRPYLETAVSLDKLATSPTLGQKQQAQQAMLAQAAALQSTQTTSPPIWAWFRRLLMPVAALTLLFFLFGGSFLTASAAALPGDALYNSKRWAEQVQLQLVQSPEQKLALREAQQAERVREVQALLRTDRNVLVSFTGNIQEITPDFWVIEDVRAQLTEETEIDGKPQLDALVRVNGRILDGQLWATHLELLTYTPEEDPEPDLLPTRRPTLEHTATATPTATEQFTRTPIATSTATTTETAVPTSSSTPTKMATPTATPSPTPTVTAVSPPDNDNDNGNDNENEEDNDNGNDDNSNDDNDNSNNGNSNDDNGNDDNGNDNDNDDDNDNDNDNDDDANDNR